MCVCVCVGGGICEIIKIGSLFLIFNLFYDALPQKWFGEDAHIPVSQYYKENCSIVTSPDLKIRYVALTKLFKHFECFHF